MQHAYLLYIHQVVPYTLHILLETMGIHSRQVPDSFYTCPIDIRDMSNLSASFYSTCLHWLYYLLIQPRKIKSEKIKGSICFYRYQTIHHFADSSYNRFMRRTARNIIAPNKRRWMPLLANRLGVGGPFAPASSIAATSASVNSASKA